MNILENMQECFGCGACYNICPYSAISMVENVEGFLEPIIDSSICTQCNICKQVCPALNPTFTYSKAPKVYAFVADPETLYASSSGGAFTVLAEKYLMNGGYVVGAAFDKDFSVHHIIISDMTDLDKLRRSKYAQSNQGLCYLETQKLLDDGKQVLYSGCPCQIAGLKGFLGKEYQNLTTIDLLCHGVPPQKHLHEYLQGTYGIENIDCIEMRGRETWNTCFKVSMKDGNIFNHNSTRDNYIRAFLRDLNLRKTCYTCRFATLPRQGDITIGDFWSAKKIKLGNPYGKKSSIVLINSEKGQLLWDKKDPQVSHNKKVHQIDLTEKFPINSLNTNITRPNAKYNINREYFFKNHLDMNFEQSVLRTLYPYDVGLVLFMSNNYGSAATNFALYKAIENIGHRPLLLDNLCPPRGVSKNFADNYLDGSKKLPIEDNDYHSVNLLCDSFVVGSDQSWRWDFGFVERYYDYLFMGFADEEKRKISYSASFGPKRKRINRNIQKFYTRMLKRFDAISVREDYAVDMCKQLFDVDAEQMIDPVFLLDKNDYIELSKKSNLKFDEKIILAYLMHPSLEKCHLTIEYAKRFGIKPIIIYDAGTYKQWQDDFNVDAAIDKPEFIDWMAYFVNADYVITDSFHGACFSLILNKEFVIIKGGAIGRFDSLANMIDDTDQHENSGFYDDFASLRGEDNIFKKRDFEVIEKKLSLARDKGLSWLKAALESPKHGHIRYDNDFLVDYARLFRSFMKNPIIEQLKNYMTARIDIKIKNNITGDFEIINISDNTKVLKPRWLNKNGTGYQIESYNLSLGVKLLSKSDGNISISLKGINVKDTSNNRIPHWIEYKKFVFNNEIIFNEKKYAWHDKPIIFTFPVTQGETYSFSVQWGPRAYLEPV